MKREDRVKWRVAGSDEEDSDDLGLPGAVHATGLAFDFQYMEVDEDRCDWCVMPHASSQSREQELREELGQEAFSQLWGELATQAMQLWKERGYAARVGNVRGAVDNTPSDDDKQGSLFS